MLNFIQMFHEKLFDLESFLYIYDRPDPKTVNINNVFQAKIYLAQIGYYQYFQGEAESKQTYNKENAYRGAQRKKRIREKIKHLKQI